MKTEFRRLGSAPPSWKPFNLLLAIVAAVLVVHLLVTAAMNHARLVSFDFGLRRAELRTAEVAEWLNRELQGVTLALDLMQRRQLLLDANDNQLGDVEATLDDLARRNRFDIVSAISIDPDWVSRWSTSHYGKPMDMRGKPHVMALNPNSLTPTYRQIYVSDLYIGQYSHRQVVTFSRRVRHADGSDAGIVSVSIDPTELTKHLAQLLPANGEGVGIWREGGSLILQSQWPFALEQQPGKPLAALLEAMTGRDSVSLQVTTGQVTTDDPEGRHVLMAARRLADCDLVVAAYVEAPVVAGWIDERAWLVWLADGATAALIVGVMVVGWLTQARRRTLQQLDAANHSAEHAIQVQRQINDVIDSVPGAIYRARYLYSGQVTFQMISHGFERLSGWSGASLLLRPGGLFELCVPPKSEEEIRALARTLQEERFLVRDRQLQRSDGSVRWVRISDNVVGSDREGVDVVGLITDVDVERAAIIGARTAARLAVLGEMATGLAHEMSQPLTAMSIMAENAIAAIRNDRLGAAVQKMERIPAMVERTKVIIDHLRLFGRRQDQHPVPAAAADAIEGALVLAETEIRKAGIKVELNMPSGLPAVLAGQVLLEQVLLNLIFNARDAMAQTDMTSRVLTIAAERRDETVAISVSDTGDGIPDHVLPQLFEPFFTTKPPGLGTGLGLSICHGIITSFGGTICAGNHGHGARFVITLPVDRRRSA